MSEERRLAMSALKNIEPHAPGMVKLIRAYIRALERKAKL